MEDCKKNEQLRGVDFNDAASLRFHSAWKSPQEDTARIVFEVTQSGGPFGYFVVKLFSQFGEISRLGNTDVQAVIERLQLVYTVKFWHGDINRTISCWRTNVPFQPTDAALTFCLRIVNDVTLYAAALCTAYYGSKASLVDNLKTEAD